MASRNKIAMRIVPLICVFSFLAGCARIDFIESIIYDSVAGPNVNYECGDLEYSGYLVHGARTITYSSFLPPRIDGQNGDLQINIEPAATSVEGDCPIAYVNGEAFKHYKFWRSVGACNYALNGIDLSGGSLEISLANESRQCQVELGEYRYRRIYSEPGRD